MAKIGKKYPAVRSSLVYYTLFVYIVFKNLCVFVEEKKVHKFTPMKKTQMATNEKICGNPFNLLKSVFQKEETVH